MPLGLLRRLLGGGDPEPRQQFQVVAHGRTMEPATEEELESLAERVGDLLEDEGEGLALGPVVGYNLGKSEVEVEFTVEATSAEAFHNKLAQILRLLEREKLVRYHDSTASRLDSEYEREPILA